MKDIAYANSFKKDFKAVSNYPNYKKKEKFFKDGLTMLQKGEKLPASYKDHLMKASGVKYQGLRNFHIAPNICVIYDMDNDRITLIRIGSHSDLGLTESLEII